jgi:hypothetical protein
LNKSGLSFTNKCPSGPSGLSGPGFSYSLMHARDQILQKRGGEKEYGEKDEGRTWTSWITPMVFQELKM